MLLRRSSDKCSATQGKAQGRPRAFALDVNPTGPLVGPFLLQRQPGGSSEPAAAHRPQQASKRPAPALRLRDLQRDVEEAHAVQSNADLVQRTVTGQLAGSVPVSAEHVAESRAKFDEAI